MFVFPQFPLALYMESCINNNPRSPFWCSCLTSQSHACLWGSVSCNQTFSDISTRLKDWWVASSLIIYVPPVSNINHTTQQSDVLLFPLLPPLCCKDTEHWRWLCRYFVWLTLRVQQGHSTPQIIIIIIIKKWQIRVTASGAHFWGLQLYVQLLEHKLKKHQTGFVFVICCLLLWMTNDGKHVPHLYFVFF